MLKQGGNRKADGLLPVGVATLEVLESLGRFYAVRFVRALTYWTRDRVCCVVTDVLFCQAED